MKIAGRALREVSRGAFLRQAPENILHGRQKRVACDAAS